jgi:hypothetical protein
MQYPPTMTTMIMIMAAILAVLVEWDTEDMLVEVDRPVLVGKRSV